MKTLSLQLFFMLLVFSTAAFALRDLGHNGHRKAAIQKCLILSDIHLDPMYGLHSDTALRRKLIDSPVTAWKGIFEQYPQMMTVNAGLLGQDANYGVLQSALDNMVKKLPHPAFIVISGDFIWHNATIADSVLKRKTIGFIAGLFKQDFPQTAIIPAMGNNDTYGNDYALQDTRFLTDFADAWSPNLPHAAADSLKTTGYYAFNLGKFRFIVINTALVSNGSNYPQAKDMLDWVQDKLAAPGRKNTWIIGHIPPGLNGYNDSPFWNSSYSQTYVNSIVQHAAGVKFMISAHTHLNDFKVFYTTAGKPVALMRIVPSICSNHGNNPSFEIAEVDALSGRVTNETNWYLNLSATDSADPASIEWNNTLSLRKSLQLDKDDAAAFSAFMARVKTSDTALNEYNTFYDINTPPGSINRGDYLNYLKADSLQQK